MKKYFKRKIESTARDKYSSLKVAIIILFIILFSRWQGDDEASNKQGNFNVLKTLILKENPNAYYIHRFAHHIQLTLVGVTNKHIQVLEFFRMIASVVKIVKSIIQTFRHPKKETNC